MQFILPAGCRGDDPSHCGRGVSEPSNQMLHRIVSECVCVCVWVGGGLVERGGMKRGLAGLKFNFSQVVFTIYS